MTDQNINCCDGCQRGLPIKDGIHKGTGYDMIGCTKDRYESSPKELKQEEAKLCLGCGISEKIAKELLKPCKFSVSGSHHYEVEYFSPSESPVSNWSEDKANEIEKDFESFQKEPAVEKCPNEDAQGHNLCSLCDPNFKEFEINEDPFPQKESENWEKPSWIQFFFKVNYETACRIKESIQSAEKRGYEKGKEDDYDEMIKFGVSRTPELCRKEERERILKIVENFKKPNPPNTSILENPTQSLRELVTVAHNDLLHSLIEEINKEN